MNLIKTRNTPQANYGQFLKIENLTSTLLKSSNKLSNNDSHFFKMYFLI